MYLFLSGLQRQMLFYMLVVVNNKTMYCVGFSRAQSRRTQAMWKAWMGEARSSLRAEVLTAAELNWIPIMIHLGQSVMMKPFEL